MQTNSNLAKTLREISNDMSTWNRPRSLAELRSFVSARDDELDVEDFVL